MVNQSPTRFGAATPASEWNDPFEVGFPIVLPESQRTVYLCAVTPDALLAIGDLPDVLSALVMAMAFEGVDKDTLEEAMKVENVSQYAKDAVRMMNLICTAAFVYPRIVPEPETILLEDGTPFTPTLPPGTTCLSRISLIDRGFVFSLCTQAVEVLRTFRARQSEDDGDGADVSKIQPATELLSPPAPEMVRESTMPVERVHAGQRGGAVGRDHQQRNSGDGQPREPRRAEV